MDPQVSDPHCHLAGGAENPGSKALQGVMLQPRTVNARISAEMPILAPDTGLGVSVALPAQRAGAGREVLALRPLSPSVAPTWDQHLLVSAWSEPTSKVPALQCWVNLGSATVGLGMLINTPQTPQY